jgi:hypothetical protein
MGFLKWLKRQPKHHPEIAIIGDLLGAVLADPAGMTVTKFIRMALEAAEKLKGRPLTPTETTRVRVEAEKHWDNR